MTKKYLSVIFTLLFLIPSNSFTQTIYVDVDASGSNDGSSWTNAYIYLQDALDVAVSGNDIWVAKGTYYPDEDKDADHIE